jgi:AcrR family transcriptional regulator
MDAVAEAAGVGKGTLFRRFGDKAGLAVALLDERERSCSSASSPADRRSGPARRRAHGYARSSGPTRNSARAS